MAPKKNKLKSKNRKKPQRSYKPRIRPRLTVRSVNAPVSKGFQTFGIGSVKYFAAPVQETFGPGLRVSCRLRGPSVCSGGTGTFTVAHGDVCPFRSYSNSAEEGWPQQAAAWVKPSFHIYDRGTTAPMEATLFASTTDGKEWSYNMLGNLARCYRYSNIRVLTAEYVPSVSTNTTGTFGLGLNFDPATLSLTQDQILNLRNSGSTPLWKSMSLNLIKDTDLRKPAARLYETDEDTNAQFNIAGFVTPSVASGSTIQVYGTIFFDITIDLYGLTNDIRSVYYDESYTLRGRKRTTAKLAEIDLGSTSSSSSGSVKVVKSSDYVIVSQDDSKEAKDEKKDKQVVKNFVIARS